MRTLRQRLVIALGIGGLFALLQIGGYLRSGAPGWAKVAYTAVVVGVAVGGGLISATFGRDKHRFILAVLLVVVAEAVAANVVDNAACFLGGCG